MRQEVPTIEWPALWFGTPGCAVLRYESEERFCRAKYRAISDIRRLTENYLIDSSGNKIDLGWPQLAQPLAGAKRLLAQLTNPWVRVVYPSKRFAGKLSLFELKKLLESVWAADRDFWAEYDFEWMRQKATQAKTVADIVRIFP